MRRPRYINEKIEEELVEFKEEIEEKFAKSEVNKNFKFPLIKAEKNLDLKPILEEEEPTM